MSLKFARIAALALACIAGGPVAFAADFTLRPAFSEDADLSPAGKFYIHAGPAGLFLSESAKISVGGAPLAGANISVKPQASFVVEAGYFLNRNFAISLTGGWPPRADVMAAGTIAGAGKLGVATYGPATLTAHYHFTSFGRFQPYIGMGPTFLIPMLNQDRVVTNLELKSSIGFAVQVGFDYMFNERWGVFFDVKKAYLRSKATGLFNGAPLAAKVKFDPLVVHTGVAFRF
ncbi:MAG: OmpW family protein [Hyphomicrobiales bacterium]|nr:OmpW family protein [Hyphomicrobiales bacterium]